MPLDEMGEWISRECDCEKHDECFYEFDDGGGRTRYCNCKCHKKDRVKPKQQ
jgi:hypothetical protein